LRLCNVVVFVVVVAAAAVVVVVLAATCLGSHCRAAARTPLTGGVWQARRNFSLPLSMSQESMASSPCK